jgi:hypothetical protein
MAPAQDGKSMMKLRLLLLFLFGAVIQASAAMMSRVVFSHETFPFNLSFFLFWLGASMALMVICMLLALAFERFMGMHRLSSHIVVPFVLTIVVLSILLVVREEQVTYPRVVKLLEEEFFLTLCLFGIVSAVTLSVRVFGSTNGTKHSLSSDRSG